MLDKQPARAGAWPHKIPIGERRRSIPHTRRRRPSSTAPINSTPRPTGSGSACVPVDDTDNARLVGAEGGVPMIPLIQLDRSETRVANQLLGISLIVSV